jgi:hypothetical protein
MPLRNRGKDALQQALIEGMSVLLNTMNASGTIVDGDSDAVHQYLDFSDTHKLQINPQLFLDVAERFLELGNPVTAFAIGWRTKNEPFRVRVIKDCLAGLNIADAKRLATAAGVKLPEKEAKECAHALLQKISESKTPHSMFDDVLDALMFAETWPQSYINLAACMFMAGCPNRGMRAASMALQGTPPTSEASWLTNQAYQVKNHWLNNPDLVIPGEENRIEWVIETWKTNQEYGRLTELADVLIARKKDDLAYKIFGLIPPAN